MATHSSILAWRIPWTEEPGGLQSVGVIESDTTKQLYTHTHTHTPPPTVNLPLYSTKKSKGTEVGLQDNPKVASSMLAILIV